MKIIGENHEVKAIQKKILVTSVADIVNINIKQAGAELCQAQGKHRLAML